eukprot:m.351402 g.351402  ORF g.351402 m.351402 type:complete len:77 (-) comp52905_c0_seq1:85-315(-)
MATFNGSPDSFLVVEEEGSPPQQSIKGYTVMSWVYIEDGHVSKYVDTDIILCTGHAKFCFTVQRYSNGQGQLTDSY